MQAYRTIKADGEAEQIIKGSRIITAFQRCDTEEQAQAFIAAKKKEHYKATHNCSAYVIGMNNEIQRANDDGEPSGTAGVPMLEVLKQTNLRNVCVVVTRYFGGTKLGAGGLVRAYGHGVSNAIQTLGMVDRELQTLLLVELSYPLLGSFDYFIEQEDVVVVDRQFTENVTLTLGVASPLVDKFIEKISDQTHGQATVTVGHQEFVEVDVVDK